MRGERTSRRSRSGPVGRTSRDARLIWWPCPAACRLKSSGYSAKNGGKARKRTWERRALELIERHWKWIVLFVWLGFCGWFIFEQWNDIRCFGLGDTDDNMRIMQVRGLLHGQGWYDLRQYRMNPPFGANIHWSRLVDLPIAGLILALRPFLGGAARGAMGGRDRAAAAHLLLLFALALTARRLIEPRAYPLAFLALFFAGSTNGMFMPERIDHHGWQLALLALSIAGDRRSEARCAAG